MARAARVIALVMAALLAAHGPSFAAPKKHPDQHRFAAVGHSFSEGGGGEEALRQAIADSSETSLAFAVVTGIKGADEQCSDKLFNRRRALFENSRRPLIVGLAASDWSGCKNSAGRSNAIERLNRLREVFFSEPETFGARKLALTRLSAGAKFRSYAENAHWAVGDVLYATINLPANNNHYLAEAGRNSEYEDRLVANRTWLKRLFAQARREQRDALVLFSEGDLKLFSQPTGFRAMLGRATSSKHDGFDEPRRQIAALAQKFEGKVLLVDTAPLAAGAHPSIEWRGNVGHLSLGSAAVEVRVTPDTPKLFSLSHE